MEAGSALQSTRLTKNQAGAGILHVLGAGLGTAPGPVESDTVIGRHGSQGWLLQRKPLLVSCLETHSSQTLKE